MKGAPTIQGRRRARIVRGDSLPRVRKSTLSRINESSLSLLTCVGICGEGALDGRNCESTCEAAVKGTSLAIVFRAWSGTSTARHQGSKIYPDSAAWVQLSVRVVVWFEFSLDREEHLEPRGLNDALRESPQPRVLDTPTRTAWTFAVANLMCV